MAQAATRFPQRGSRRGRRPASEAQRTRERVLQRAEQLFARHGYRGTSMRAIAARSRVHMFTIQHHFGSKLGLYEAIVRRWDQEVEQLVSDTLRRAQPDELAERVVDALFDFFLGNRTRVALSARCFLGEGLPKRATLGTRRWMRFLAAAIERHRLQPETDPRLLLMTAEGMLHHHVLAAADYCQLFGRDVTEPQLRAQTKRHLARVIRALVGVPPGGREKRGEEK